MVNILRQLRLDYLRRHEHLHLTKSNNKQAESLQFD